MSVVFRQCYPVDKILCRGTSYVTERPSRVVTGSYCRLPLTYTWSIPHFLYHLARSLISAMSQFSLLVFDIVQSSGGILNIRWINDGVVTTGAYCTAQGAIKQIGALGVSLISLVCDRVYDSSAH